MTVDTYASRSPVDPARSQLMGRVRQKHSGPELCVRSALHRAGYRYRLHAKDLPGSPDILLPRYGIALFVHGCFWHRHAGCRRTTMPKTRADFWAAKFRRNVERDAEAAAALRELGWIPLVLWECECADAGLILGRLADAIAQAAAAGAGSRPRSGRARS